MNKQTTTKPHNPSLLEMIIGEVFMITILIVISHDNLLLCASWLIWWILDEVVRVMQTYSVRESIIRKRELEEKYREYLT